MQRPSALGLVALLLGSIALLFGPTAAVGSVPEHAAPAAQDHANHHHGPDGLALDAKQFKKKDAPEVAAAAPYDVDRHAEWTAGEWDGVVTTVDAPDLKTGNQVHAIYVYPAKTQSRLKTFGAMFQADARDANRILGTRTKALRFDERVTNGSNYLDITSFQSRYRASQLAGSNQFSLVANEIAAKFNAPNKKYVVWLDAGSQYCGQGTLWTDPSRVADNASNVNRTTGIVYRPYATTDAKTGGFCRGRTLLHELGHNLGAVQPTAPNAFDGAHCNDSAEDVMCYTAAAESRLGVVDADTGDSAELDHNSDDYWDPLTGPPLLRWTMNLSTYLCNPTSC